MSIVLAMSLFGGGPVAAVETATAALDGRAPRNADCPGAALFGGRRVERAAYCALLRQEFISLRALARDALAEAPTSVRAHYLMAAAYHLGDGSLARALFHAERADALFVERFGPGPYPKPAAAEGAASPVPLHLIRGILWRKISVLGEMDRHEAKIAAVAALKTRLGVDEEVTKAWSLMKLGRYDDAARAVASGLAAEDPWLRAMARTAACALESEQGHRYRGYEACRAAARAVDEDPVGSGTRLGAVEYTNEGAAAVEVYEFDAAERAFVEATRRRVSSSVNPWRWLVRLQLRTGRLAEALSSWRAMMRYRARQATHLAQQADSDLDLTTASLMLVAGRPELADRLVRRMQRRPDRQGTSSVQPEQHHAAIALLDRTVAKTLAVRRRNRAAIAPGWQRPRHWAAYVALRFRAFWAGRTALRFLSGGDILAATLRPEAPGSVEQPPWLDGEVAQLVGRAVADAVIAGNRQTEVLPASLADPVFDGLGAEAALFEGDCDAAEARARRALQALVVKTPLFRARVAVLAAEAARCRGDWPSVRRHQARAIRDDPQVFFRLGAPLVVRPEVDAGGTGLAERVLSAPLLMSHPAGLMLRVREGGAVLMDAEGGAVLRMAEAKGTSEDAQAWSLFLDLFAPDLDLTQTDVRSLDGGVGGGGRASEAFDAVLRAVERAEGDSAP